MSPNDTDPPTASTRRLHVVADTFPETDVEWWRSACLTAWIKALDLHDEVERLKAQLGEPA